MSRPGVDGGYRARLILSTGSDRRLVGPADDSLGDRESAQAG
jgi:hypothetical protein